jgi:hypothetical protein
MHAFSRIFSAGIDFRHITITGITVMGKFLLILLMLATTNTFAGIIKWVDDQGQVHYSDQVPPPGTLPKTLREDSKPQDSASSSPSAPKTLAEREAELKKEKAEQQSAAEKAAQQKAALEALKTNCATAQDNLRSLQSGVRIMEINGNGERTYIDDAQRQQRIEKAQQDISNYCK